MQDQPKYKYLRGSEFFSDGRSARPLVENTVARGELRRRFRLLHRHDSDTERPEPTTEFPIQMTRQVIDRGQERFNIYCSPCHGQLGNGLGMIVRRGFKQPPSYHIDRLRQIGVGHFYDVMTNGYGAMWKYSAQIEPRDRWAIAAYIRVLQASQNTNFNELPPDERSKLPAAQAVAAIDLTDDNACSFRSERGALMIQTTQSDFAITHELAEGIAKYRNTAAFLGLAGHSGLYRGLGNRARSVLPVIPGRLLLLVRDILGFTCAPDGSTPDGRRLGHGDPADLGSWLQNIAVPRDSLHPDLLGNPISL